METQQLKNIIEAALLAAGHPLTLDNLQDLFEEGDAPPREELRAALEALAGDYAERGLELVEVGSGWRLQVKQALAPWISRLWEERPARYSRALLETLALIAYRQPITRGEIEDIRGVGVSTNIIKTLQEREWIRVVGHRDVPGKPAIYGTTRQFLDYFNLKSLDELPTLAQLRDLDTISAELDFGMPPSAAAEPAQAANDALADADDEITVNGAERAEEPQDDDLTTSDDDEDTGGTSNVRSLH